ncbi:MAG: hypothetical protein K8R55_00785 [Desulfuromonadaceae bacterium]|nr:hypothetical protein [Desulfuromonadaceae bacterium]
MRTLALIFAMMLLSAPAFGTEDLALIENKGFNATVQTALKAGEAWPHHPVAVSLLFIGQQEGGKPQIGHQEEIRMQSRAEAFEDAVVTVERFSFMDDSIAGDKFIIRLQKQDDGGWLIESARFGQKCWEGRGHQNYSKEYCL